MKITALYAALLTLLYIGLSMRVIAVRLQTRTTLGDADNPELIRRIRAHANCAEYAPLGLLLIAIAESLATPAWWLHALGLGLLAGRCAHAWGISTAAGPSAGRSAGMGLTFATLLLAALTDLRAAL